MNHRNSVDHLIFIQRLAAAVATLFLLLFFAMGCSDDPDGENQEQNQEQNQTDPGTVTVSITAGPQPFTNETTAVFAFACNDPSGCIFECSIDVQQNECGEEEVFADLDDGEYTLTVVAINSEGDTSEPATWTWVVDTVAPVVEILAGPDMVTVEPTAQFTFSCSKADCLYECRLNTEPFDDCDEDFSLAIAEPGEQLLVVRAIDPAGNVSDEVEYSWKLTTEPEERFFTALASGGDTSCAIGDDATLWCWGSTPQRSLPIQIGNDADWQYPAVGVSHQCALKTDNSLWCWGDGGDGRLGLGDTQARSNPVQVGDHTDWTDVVAGRDFSCAIRAEGELYCWGHRDGLGLGSDAENQLEPARVGEADDWHQISASHDFACALRSEGTLWCWGIGGLGGLGQGDTQARREPTQVGTDSDWSDISVGAFHTCGIRDEAIWCWGANQNGELGLDRTSSMETLPEPVVSDAQWAAVFTSGLGSSGGNSTCALRTDESLWCWGSNHVGQLGLGDKSARLVPTVVGEYMSFQQVALGDDHGCALSAGDLYCWGFNDRGQLGLGLSIGDRFIPDPVAHDGEFTVVSSGRDHGCAISEGALYCWGAASSSLSFGSLGTGDSLRYGQPTRIGDDEDWETVAGGNSFTCGIRAPGTLWCWGSGSQGQLGQGNFSLLREPAQVESEEDWQVVTTSMGRLAGLTFPPSPDQPPAHACAIREDGSLWCWGAGADGQLGIGPTPGTEVPTLVGSADWLDVSAGLAHTCAIADDTTLWCWGDGADGRLGLGTTATHDTPQQVGTAQDWQEVSAGERHTCGVRDDGSLWCWGAGSSGQLGLGGLATQNTPQQVGAAQNWASVTAGHAHTCAVTTAGAAYCWGDGANGRLGNSSGSPRNVPTALAGDEPWTTLSAGRLHTYGLTSDGFLRAWGSNTNMQLGNGTHYRLSPTLVFGESSP